MSLLAGSLATQVTGDLIGPYQEGSQLRLRCEVGGAKPAPRIFWFMGDKLLHGIETSPELYNVTESVRSNLRLKDTR